MSFSATYGYAFLDDGGTDHLQLARRGGPVGCEPWDPSVAGAAINACVDPGLARRPSTTALRGCVRGRGRDVRAHTLARERPRRLGAG
jgi:hypothetical protein